MTLLECQKMRGVSIRLDTISALDRRTNRWTNGTGIELCVHSMLTRDKSSELPSFDGTSSYYTPAP